MAVDDQESADPVLKIQSISISYGSIGVLWDVSLEVRVGEVVSLIGANGAGKSTLLKAIMGLVRPKGGEITFEGNSLLKMRPHKIVSTGISFVPEGRRLFPGMSVEENLKMSTPRRCPDISQRVGDVFALFPILEERKSQPAGTLSGGEQQMVAIGRALMAKPKLLLLDEPSFGLSPIAYEKVLTAVRKINQSGVAILLAEQNSERALEISQTTYVLENGRVSTSGKSNELMNDPAIRMAYLGV